MEFETLLYKVRKWLQNIPRTFRVNRLKISVEEFLEFSNINAIQDECFDFVFWTNNSVGKTLEYHLGLLHTQSYSSILVPLVLNPCPHSKVLDTAAAPGGKTTEMADLMKNSGSILAYEKKVERTKALVGNLKRLGVINTAVFIGDSRYLPYRNEFDYVLADVPCSSLGSDPKAKYSRKRIRDFVRIQRKLILSAFDALKPGGTLVYSTCTITEEENEKIVRYLLEQREDARVEKIKLPVDFEESDVGIRIYPWHVNSEAFFISKITKKRIQR